MMRSQLRKACGLLSSNNTTDLLKDSFRCAWPGFAADMTVALAQSISSQVRPDGFALDVDMLIKTNQQSFTVLPHKRGTVKVPKANFSLHMHILHPLAVCPRALVNVKT